MAWWNPLDVNPVEKAAEIIFTPKEANPGEDQYIHGYSQGYQAGEVHQHHIDQQHEQAQHHHDTSHSAFDSGHVTEGLGGLY